MSRPPLPILTTVYAAYASLIEGLLTFLHIAGGWYLIAVAVPIGLTSLAHTLPQVRVAIIAATITSTAAAIAVAVSWHRFILLGEQPAGPLPLKLRPSLDYLLRALIVGAGAAIMGGLISAALWFTRDLSLFGPMLLMVYVCLILIAGRLLLIYPAAAIGERRMTLKASWAFTARNSWRILAGISLTAMPILLLMGLVSSSGALQQSGQLIALIDLALSYVNLALLAGFASHAYRHFTQV